MCADYDMANAVVNRGKILYYRAGAYPEVVKGQEVHPGPATDDHLPASVLKEGVNKPPYPSPGAGFIPGYQ
ncbi:hypothetical protein GCM10023091_32670 [Ravibacter arvi]|uniref:Uncharacterized protein n=1 Tax=Ravibacter arvi TaxID=2051041 RepID=A0ABP8M360_9BACT